MTISTTSLFKVAITLAFVADALFFGFREVAAARVLVAFAMLVAGAVIVYIASKCLLSNKFSASAVAWAMILVTLSLLLRGFPGSAAEVITALGHPFMHMAYILVFSLVITEKYVEPTSILHFVSKVYIVTAMFSVALLPVSLYFAVSVAFSRFFDVFPVVFIDRLYKTGKVSLPLFLGVITPYLIYSQLAGRRVAIVYVGVVGVCILALQLIRRGGYLRTMAILGVVSLVGVAFSFGGQLQQELVSSGRLVDTRTFLFSEVLNSMSGVEIWIGRGILGTYFSDYFWYSSLDGRLGDHYDRVSVEVGYLHLYLKGGLLFVAGALLIFCQAVIRDLSSSINSRDGRKPLLSLLILPLAVVMAVSYYPTFSGLTLLLWYLSGVAIRK